MRIRIAVMNPNKYEVLYTENYDVDGDKSEALALILKKLVEVLG